MQLNYSICVRFEKTFICMFLDFGASMRLLKVVVTRKMIVSQVIRLAARWRAQGVAVTVIRRDVTDDVEAKLLMDEALKQAPVGGIFHLAAVCTSLLLPTISFHERSLLFGI